MRYLPFDTGQAAIERNMIEAIRRGCDMVTTRYWWPMVEIGGKFGLIVDENDEGLTELERLNLTELNNENE